MRVHVVLAFVATACYRDVSLVGDGKVADSSHGSDAGSGALCLGSTKLIRVCVTWDVPPTIQVNGQIDTTTCDMGSNYTSPEGVRACVVAAHDLNVDGLSGSGQLPSCSSRPAI